MRRLGGVWPQVTSFAALLSAYQRAARGKRQTAACAAFAERREPALLRLQELLRSGRWRPGRAHEFVIHDPKRRTITAVPFEDRVVHHALVAPLVPWFERRLDAHTFACRTGRGAHRALAHVKALVRRHRYTLKLDVRQFFASLQHSVVLRALDAQIKDGAALALIRTILAGRDGRDVRGLPIGSLTSQWFANVTLSHLDRFVREHIRPAGYARYMDDFVLCDDDKPRLQVALPAIAQMLDEQLGLQLKANATRLAPVQVGLPFLGFVVFPRLLRVQPRNLRRYRWRLRWLRWALARGEINEARYRRATAAVWQHLAIADTLRLRQRWLADHPLELT